ncbi:MAG: response regulator [Anaerolineales bacterium]|jgi:YesN/AraC family two-component response regulator|nr:response regulator [Anaerolineales bacterium]
MSATDAGSTPKLRVLIADDFHETRRSVRLMLSMNPDVVVVAIAKDGREAVELAREHHPDIVILDINMPQLDGLTAFKQISEIYADTGCILISAQREIQVLDTAITLGVQEYLGKPFTIEELNDAVNRVGKKLRQKRPSLENAGRLHKQSEIYLEKLANEYAKSRRTDDKALEVFEHLAENPGCELRWLRTLAMLYIIRQEWGKLKALATRLEKQAKK